MYAICIYVWCFCVFRLSHAWSMVIYHGSYLYGFPGKISAILNISFLGFVLDSVPSIPKRKPGYSSTAYNSAVGAAIFMKIVDTYSLVSEIRSMNI